MAARQVTFEEFRVPGRLEVLLADMKQAFGGLVDMGVVDERGTQVAYAGPFELRERSYGDQDWFREVSSRGVYVSNVILGHRNVPHIVIAIRHDMDRGRWFVLCSTIDTDVFHFLIANQTRRRQNGRSECRGCHSLGVRPSSDVLLANQEQILQTPSRFYGEVLDRSLLPTLPASTNVEVIELEDESGEQLIASYAEIERSPFTLVLLNPRVTLRAGWRSLRGDLLLFLALSVALIILVVVWGSNYMISRAREADLKRAALHHQLEYTNKLAAIGRLGAGVAHGIESPLSIIGEKAAMLRNLLTQSWDPPPQLKLVGLVDSIIESAERCGGVTHRLIGFAKHIDVQRATIDLDQLLREVLGFLEQEANHRQIEVVFDHRKVPVTIVTDKDQLEQVFWNILNNAFAAVKDGGRITIGIAEVSGEQEDAVTVTIADDGEGVPEDQLAQIFDPFFTTKEGAGTGLGLFITYGIVQKLGGQIGVQSTVGEGTCFTVTLPTGEQD